MAQGKLKVKAKLPKSVKKSQQNRPKGPAIQRRGNAPIQPKKSKQLQITKLKQKISQEKNKEMESELRERALEGKQSLTKKDKNRSDK